jgi:4-hydroxy 2-oxovalerate aldolase
MYLITHGGKEYMKQIQLLDCTLRDGGHITNSYFGKDVMQSVIHYLEQSCIEIIEVGFLQNCDFDENRAMYNNVAQVQQVLNCKSSETKYSLMAQADLYSFDKLEQNNGFIDLIRISFHDIHISEGLTACREVMKKGYPCSVNPINLLGYSDKDVLELIDKVNEIHPYAFAIVDTFGSLLRSDLKRLYFMIDNNLNKDIKLAVHLHENQALSYSLAQDFIEMSTPYRDLMIDGSLYGMGRVPGNLCIELIMSYMNRTQGANYNLDPVFDAIDEHISKIKKHTPWGYATPYALAGRFKVHRSYAEYLMNKGKLKTKQINQILSMIDKSKSSTFDREYIENLYIEYQSIKIDDADSITQLERQFNGKELLLVGPGKSLITQRLLIKTFIHNHHIPVIAANFVWEDIVADYCFFTNIRRYEEFRNKVTTEDVIITSNLLPLNLPYTYALNYSEYAFCKDAILDNCMIMLLKFLRRIGIKSIYMVGFDGFGEEQNFALSSMEHDVAEPLEQEQVVRFLNEMRNSGLLINFVTHSKYDVKEQP